MADKTDIYKKLFVSTFSLSLFTFGGGYVIISLMKKKFVDEFGWIKEKDIIDIFAISQSAPGIIAVNASLLIGYKMAGIKGALITLAGTILPPLVIISLISLFYAAFRDSTTVHHALLGMRAAVAAVIADVVIRMGTNILSEKSLLPIFIMVGALISSLFFGVNIILIIVFAGLIGFAKTFYYDRRGRAKS